MSPNDQNTHLYNNGRAFLPVRSSQTSHLHSHPATKQFYFTATFLTTQWKLPYRRLHFNLVGISFQLRRRGIISLHHADELVAHSLEIHPQKYFLLTLITPYAKLMASTRYIG
jgi:hypothetical protein